MSLKHILAGAFGAGVAYRNGLYDSGRLSTHELRGPVVSIGNISVGGSGKTPFTIYLGSLLKQRGIAFDIISRGYRRHTTGNRIVDPKGSSREFGDEPLLMARELGVDVVVGEDRVLAGQLAERTWGPRLHLLDDAFQHRRLARQFDIVLVSPEDLTDSMLPAGRLREPLSALSRADAIVITGDTDSSKLPTAIPTWRLHRDLYIDASGAPSFPSFGEGGSANTTIADGAPYLPSSGRCGVTTPIAFCGIAKPAAFFANLRALGITPAAETSFRDHHRYTDSDLRRLQHLAELHQADSFITTAKDAINLEPVWNPSVWGGHACPPLLIAKLKLTLENAEASLQLLLATLSQRGHPAS